MGSGGGGSVGKVEYPSYLMTHHSALLSNGGTDAPVYSMFDSLNEAHAFNPFAGQVTYKGTFGPVNLTVAQAIAEIIGQTEDPFILFQSNLTAVNSQPFTLATIQTSLERDSETAELETQRLLHVYTGKQIKQGSVFSSAYVTGRVKVRDAKMRSLLVSGTEKISGALVQLNKNKIEDANGLLEMQLQNFTFSKSVYALAVEHCKLETLNEREYFEQTQYYIKHSAHWEFERGQAAGNAIAMLQMGKKMTWVASPDMPKWMVSASWVFGDPVGTSLLRRSKRFRATVMGGASGAASGAPIGGWVGAVVGAVIGGATSYATYSEGEWR
jgi:hypothetical protein